METQGDMFETDNMLLMHAQINELKKLLDNVRRGAFSRINDMEKRLIEMEHTRSVQEIAMR